MFTEKYFIPNVSLSGWKCIFFPTNPKKLFPLKRGDSVMWKLRPCTCFKDETFWNYCQRSQKTQWNQQREKYENPLWRGGRARKTQSLKSIDIHIRISMGMPIDVHQTRPRHEDERILRSFFSFKSNQYFFSARCLLRIVIMFLLFVNYFEPFKKNKTKQLHKSLVSIWVSQTQCKTAAAVSLYCWLSLDWIKNPQSVQSETETRPSKNAFETLKSGLETMSNLKCVCVCACVPWVRLMFPTFPTFPSVHTGPVPTAGWATSMCFTLSCSDPKKEKKKAAGSVVLTSNWEDGSRWMWKTKRAKTSSDEWFSFIQWILRLKMQQHTKHTCVKWGESDF